MQQTVYVTLTAEMTQ